MARYLADTSVLARRKTRPEVREILEPLLVSGRVATCGMIDLELLYSAVGPRDYASVGAVLRALPRVPMSEEVLDRALEVQARLARHSQHRGASLPISSSPPARRARD
jgi:predicted nucleic acid-binding protein